MKKVKTFKEFIWESLDSKLNFKKDSTDDSESVVYTFYTKGIPNKLVSVEFSLNEEENKIWDMEFTTDGKVSQTDKGEQFVIFSTVIKIIKQFIVEYKPNEILFLGYKRLIKDKNSPTGFSTSSSRINLYSHLLQRFEKEKNDLPISFEINSGQFTPDEVEFKIFIYYDYMVLLKNIAKNGITWVKPDLNSELEEIKRTADEYSPDQESKEENFKTLKELFKAESGLIELTDNTWKRLDNTDSNKKKITHIIDIIRVIRGYDSDRSISHSLKQFEQAKVQAPIVLFGRQSNKDNDPYLIAGNTRLMLVKLLQHLNPKFKNPSIVSLDPKDW